jgi:hypothetical protein
MPGLASGAEDFAALARRLRDAGEKTLKAELYKKINDAAKPIARKITDAEHLRAYLPDRYAEVLAADLRLTVSKLTGQTPGVSIRARGREKKRKVQLLDKGLINHPVYAQGDRARWNWENGQTGGMRAGFFSDPCQDAVPEVRAKILEAMADVERKITGG